jgi:hypothetical protein
VLIRPGQGALLGGGGRRPGEAGGGILTLKRVGPFPYVVAAPV